MRLLLITIVFLLLCSCKNSYYHDFGTFRVRLPSKWKIQLLKCIDSCSGEGYFIYTDTDTITLSINDNSLSYNVFEDSNVTKIDSSVYNYLKLNTEKETLSKFVAEQDIIGIKKLPCILNDTYYYIDTIDSKQVAVFKPKKTQGFMGILIDNGDKFKVFMNVKNPKNETKKELEKAFYSIKWNK